MLRKVLKKIWFRQCEDCDDHEKKKRIHEKYYKGSKMSRKLKNHKHTIKHLFHRSEINNIIKKHNPFLKMTTSEFIYLANTRKWKIFHFWHQDILDFHEKILLWASVNVDLFSIELKMILWNELTYNKTAFLNTDMISFLDKYLSKLDIDCKP